MDQPTMPAQSKATRGRLSLWAIVFSVVILMPPILVHLQDTTVLTPDHENVEDTCLAVAGLSGLLIIGLVFRKTRNAYAGIARRVVASVLWGFAAAIAMVILTLSAANFVEGRIDFPRSSTFSVDGVIPISRAYRSHNRNGNWTAWTEPYNAMLYIARQDYDFMLAHRRPGDEGRDPDRISSKGYFCVSVSMEQSGDNVRIIHAGDHQLPAGSVGFCSSSGT